jgi:hypothetical protein
LDLADLFTWPVERGLSDGVVLATMPN